MSVSSAADGPQRSGGADIVPSLLARCRTGDADAWNRLVARYERLVFSVALQNGLGREDAADVTQSTFIALLESLHRIHTDESLPSWLITVARRQAWRLRKSRQREWPTDEVVELPVNPASSWENVVAVHEAMEKLAPPCRDLILLLYFDPAEPSYADVAARLGRAIGGIGPMRARCLERLRTLMDEDQ